MEPYVLMLIPYFLLDEEWKEDGVECNRISYMLSSCNGEVDHKKHIEEQKKRLLDENDNDYSRWVFTAEKYRYIGGAVGHVTVFHFRTKDVW